MFPLSSLTTIIGPVIFTQLFGYFTKPDAPVTFAGAPYLMAAFFILVAALVLFAKVRPAKQNETAEASAG